MSHDSLPPLPEGHKFYGPLEPATLTDGWCYGYITASPCDQHPDGCESGDGYAVAPDGAYAGLVWSTECPWVIEPVVGSASDDGLCFGVFEVRFTSPVATMDDLVANFRTILPHLRAQYARSRQLRDA